MSKIYVNTTNVKNSCYNDITNLKNEMNMALDNLNNIDLPFSCDELSSAKRNISSALADLISFESVLKDSCDYVLSNETLFLSAVNNIDDWNLN